MLNRIPRLTALATGSVVTFSVIYDWAYFKIVDDRFFSNLALGDHIASAIESLPLILVIWFFGFLYIFRLRPNIESLNKAIDMGGPLRPIHFISMNSVSFGVRVDSIFTISIFWFIFILLSIFSRDFPFFLIIIPIVISWPRIIRASCEGLEKMGIKHMNLYLFLVPIILTTAANAGFTRGQWDLRSKPTHTFYSQQLQMKEDVLLLRRSGDGLLLRMPKLDRNLFIPWNHIDLLERKRSPRNQSLACRWFAVCWLDRMKIQK